MENYQAFLERVQSIVTAMGYHIEMRLTDETYVFSIYDNETRACYMQIGKSTGNIIVGKTRHSKTELEDLDIFIVSWISTETPYKGKGLALLLLIYGICYLKEQFPDINYVTLDDDSDRNDKILKNIYDSLGFVFKDNIAIDISGTKKLKLSTPDKQLLLDDEFIRRANYILNEKFGRNGGKRKGRKTRKNKKTKKPIKNKKTKKSRKN